MRCAVPWPALIPRLITALWSVWAGATSYAYVHETPQALEATESFLHIPIWGAWCITATVLALGSAQPTFGPPWMQWLGTGLRVGGMAMCAGLLMAWSTEFFTSDMARGWVTGKNYLMLAVLAMITAMSVSVNRFDLFAPTTPENITHPGGDGGT